MSYGAAFNIITILLSAFTIGAIVIWLAIGIADFVGKIKSK